MVRLRALALRCIEYERIGIRGRAGFFSFSHLPSFFSLFFFLFPIYRFPFTWVVSIFIEMSSFIELFLGYVGLRRVPLFVTNY